MSNKPVGILRFNLDDPIQFQDFEASLNGPRYKNRMEGIYDNVFRPTIRYRKSFLSDKNATDSEYKLVELIWEKMSEYLEELK